MPGFVRPRKPPPREFPWQRCGRTRSWSSFSPGGLVAAAWYLVELAVFQTQRAELAAPDAAAVQCGEPLGELESERRPMAAEQGEVVLRAQFEPGVVARRRHCAFGAKVHFSVRRREAHARHGVHDDAQAIPAYERIAPPIRLAAIHVGEEVTIVRRSK